MGATASLLRRGRGTVAPEPLSLPSSGAGAEAKGGDGVSWPPAEAKNPTPVACLRDAAGFSTAPAGGSSPPGPAPGSRPSSSPSFLLEGKGRSASASDKATSDAAEIKKRKTGADQPVFFGRCRFCGWEDRVPLYILYQHPSLPHATRAVARCSGTWRRRLASDRRRRRPGGTPTSEEGTREDRNVEHNF